MSRQKDRGEAMTKGQQMLPNADVSLYLRLKTAGVPLDSHESDLYALVTPESWAIVKASGWGGVTTFTSNIDGKVWFDLPFAYSPWWERRQSWTD